jgi:hypothetical protein
MLKRLAIFAFVLGASFCFILFSQKEPEKGEIGRGIEFLAPTSTSEIAIEKEQSSEKIIENFVEDKISDSTEIREELEDIIEQIDVLEQEINRRFSVKQVAGAETEFIASSTEAATSSKEIAEDKEELKKETLVIKPTEPVVCLVYPGAFPGRNKIIINELAWAGSLDSANDEWLELKNVSSEDVDLTGWQLVSSQGEIKIFFAKGDRISEGSFYLLERTDDQTVPGFLADKIYSGNLKNDGGNLFLFDQDCRLQDALEFLSGWPAGDNNSRKTMERKDDFSWQTSGISGGTPKRGNSPGYTEIILSNVQVGVLDKPVYPKILISEIQIEGKNDFVEIFNPNEADVNLTGWYLQRKTENAADFSTYASHNLFSGKIIKAKDYFLLANASSSFLAQATTTNPLTENNALALKNPNGDIVDKVGWGNAPEYESAATVNPTATATIGRKWSSTTEVYIDTDNNYLDFEAQNPTPGFENQSVPTESATGSEATTTEPLPEPEFPTSTELSVVINEIAWSGSASSSYDEWIELYNNTENDIDLANWTIFWSHGTTTFTNSAGNTIIPAKNFYLLERTDDDSAPIVTADLIYAGALKNEGEFLELRDAGGKLIDFIDCSSGWFAGDNNEKRTMEKIDSLFSGNDQNNWASSTVSGGTPKAKNSSSIL